jgi:hypothetical protein
MSPNMYFFDAPLLHSVIYRIFCLSAQKTKDFADNGDSVSIPRPFEVGPSIFIMLDKLREEMDATPIEMMEMLMAVIKNYGERNPEVIQWVRDIDGERE